MFIKVLYNWPCKGNYTKVTKKQTIERVAVLEKVKVVLIVIS